MGYFLTKIQEEQFKNVISELNFLEAMLPP